MLFFLDLELGFIFQKEIVIFSATFVCFWSKRWVFPDKLILPSRQSLSCFHKESKTVKVFKELLLNPRAWRGTKQNVLVALQWATYTLFPPASILWEHNCFLVPVVTEKKREEVKFESEWSPNNLVNPMGLMCGSKQDVNREALWKQKVLDGVWSFTSIGQFCHWKGVLVKRFIYIVCSTGLNKGGVCLPAEISFIHFSWKVVSNLVT